VGESRAAAQREGRAEPAPSTHSSAVETVCAVAAVALVIALLRGVQVGAPWQLLLRDTVNLTLVAATYALLRAGRGAPAWRALAVGYSANYLFWLGALGLEFGRYELVQLGIALTALALLLGRRWLWIGFAAACAAVAAGALRDAGHLGPSPTLAPAVPALTLPAATLVVVGVLALFLDRFGVTVREALDAALARERELARANEALRAEAAAHLRTEALLVKAREMEAVARLAGGVAHDFSNLLMVINGHAELLRDALRDRPDLAADVDVLHDAGASAAALTRQLLAFGRRQALEPRVLDLNAHLQRTERVLRRMVGDGVRLELRLAPGLWAVRADPSQLEQVVMNLAVNARDAMPGGGTLVVSTANVTLDAAEAGARRPLAPGDHVLLTVADDGVGMEAGVLERAFEPFFTTKPEGKGTGLGLATVHGIVTQSGGHVAVDSAPGKGTVFRIHLPRHAGAPAGAVGAGATPGGSP
jgi:signal transduction histidine kinase